MFKIFRKIIVVIFISEILIIKTCITIQNEYQKINSIRLICVRLDCATLIEIIAIISTIIRLNYTYKMGKIQLHTSNLHIYKRVCPFTHSLTQHGPGDCMEDWDTNVCVLIGFGALTPTKTGFCGIPPPSSPGEADIRNRFSSVTWFQIMSQRQNCTWGD